MERFLIPQPSTIEAARRIGKGARVAIYWHNPPFVGWWPADVLDILPGTELFPDDTVPGDSVNASAFYCHFQFDDGVTGDIEWNDLFNGSEGVLLSLPPDGMAAFPDFVPPAVVAVSGRPLQIGKAGDDRPSGSEARPKAAAGRLTGGKQGWRARKPAGEAAKQLGRPAKRARTGLASVAGAGGALRRAAQGLAGEEVEEEEEHQQGNPSVPAQRLQHDAWQTAVGSQQEGRGQPASRRPGSEGMPGSSRRGGAASQPSQHSTIHIMDEDGEYRRPSSTKRRQGPPPRDPRAVAAAAAAAAAAGEFADVPDPPRPPEAGIIKRIELWDFMCHAHMAIDLSPHLNLLCGRNGSGKSTLLVALQCCMGARAADTGRFRNMSAFVRKGASRARVKVTLWNTGQNAFRRAELGPEISVQRTINAGKGSTHEILDCRGRVALRGSAAVHEMVDELSINCSNPAIVLTQEMAKRFASQQSERDKFHGFMEATEFQKVLEQLVQSEGNIVGVEDLVAELAADLAQLTQQQEAMTEQMQQMQEIREWERSYAELEKCLAWAPVEQAEGVVAELRDILEVAAPADKAARQARIGSFTAQIASLDARLGEKEAALRSAEATVAGRQEELGLAATELKRRKGEAKALERRLRGQRAELAELEAECADVEAARLDVNAEFEESTRQQLADYQAAVWSCKDKKERATVAASSARQHLAERQAAADEAQQAEAEARRQLAEGRRRQEQLEQELRSLQAAQGNALAKFGGPGAAELHHAVQQAQREGRFSLPPIHIGSSLSLSDPQWATAAELVVGKLLNHWIVNTQADANVIRALQQNLRVKPHKGSVSVVVMAYRHPAHTIPPSRRVPVGRLTLLDVLRFAEGPHSHVVRNVCIDQVSAERTVLTGSHAEALDVVRHEKAFYKKYKLAGVVSQDGMKCMLKGASETTFAPPHSLRPRLVRDVSQQVAECRQELQQAETEVARLEAECEAKREALAEARGDVQKATAAHKEAVRQRQVHDSAYREALTQQPVGLAAPADGAGGEAEQRVATLRGRIAEMEAQVEDSEDQLAAAKEEVDRLNQRRAAAQQMPQHVADQLAALQGSIEDLGREKQARQGELDAAVAAAAAVDAAVADLRDARLPAVERQLAEALRVAELMCTREEAVAARVRLEAEWRRKGKSKEQVAALRDYKQLQHHAHATERRINKRQEDAGVTLAELESKLEAVKRRRWKRDVHHASADRVCRELSAAWQRRKSKFKELRSRVASAVSRHFGSYLHYRGNRGYVKVDYKAGRLAMAVGVDGREPTANMGTLSGGERSLASLAFILALGRVGVNPPFMAMDEFDVFMDSVNRRHAVQMLLEFAYRHPDRQLLLLTLQDIKVVDEARAHVVSRLRSSKDLAPDEGLPADLIKVLRLQPPRERAQRGTQQDGE